MDCGAVRFLYAPLTCRTRYAMIRCKQRRVQVNIYAQSADFLEKYSFRYAADARRYVAGGVTENNDVSDKIENGDVGEMDDEY